MDEYEELHRLEAVVEALGNIATQQGQLIAEHNREVEELRERAVDLEARQFADRFERDLDLQKWRDGIAAEVGRDLEAVADKMMEAMIDLEGRDEEPVSVLDEAYSDLCLIIGELLAIGSIEEA